MGSLQQETGTRAVIVNQDAPPSIARGCIGAGCFVPGPLRDCRRQRTRAGGDALSGSVVGGALTTEADVSRGTDVATDPAIGRIDQQIDADVVAVGEPRIAA